MANALEGGKRVKPQYMEIRNEAFVDVATFGIASDFELDTERRILLGSFLNGVLLGENPARVGVIDARVNTADGSQRQQMLIAVEGLTLTSPNRSQVMARHSELVHEFYPEFDVRLHFPQGGVGVLEQEIAEKTPFAVSATILDPSARALHR